MIRTVLAVMAGLLCTLAGFRYAGSLRAEASRLNRWCRILDRLSLLLKERAHALPEALLLAADGRDEPDKLLQAAARAVQQHPLTPLSDAFCSVCGQLPEQDCISRLCAGLCRGSLESRLLAIEHCMDELALMHQDASQRADKDARLWQTLGMIGGVCITIMLI